VYTFIHKAIVLYKHERGKIMSVTFTETQFLYIENNHGKCYMTSEGWINLELENSSSVQEVFLGRSYLQVIFHSDPKTTYFYEGVTLVEMVSLVNSDSVGSFIAKKIIPNHEMSKTTH
jgi:hypothetical protein